MDNVFLTMSDFPDLFLEMLVFVGLKMDGKKQIPTPTDSRKVAGEHISPENWSLNAD